MIVTAKTIITLILQGLLKQKLQKQQERQQQHKTKMKVNYVISSLFKLMGEMHLYFHWMNVWKVKSALMADTV